MAARPAAPTTTRLRPITLLGAAAFLLGAAALAMLVGPAGLPAAGVLRTLLGEVAFLHVHSGLSPLERSIVLQVRAPRVVLGGVVGATLALCGASYQGVFQNALADPYLLGVASGAGLGATLAIVAIPSASAGGFDPLPLAAFAGAILAVSATYALGRAGRRARAAGSLVLAGVAVGSFLTAIQTYAQQRSQPTVAAVYSWILGGLSAASWQQVGLVTPYVVLAAVVLLGSRRLLDVMSVGDDEADSLGVHAGRVRLAIVIAATLGSAAVVSVSGLIGFVGIVVPHTIRLLAGPSYRRILPLSVLCGGGFLILADLVARTLLSPAEIPIGVVTAFVGAPFFLVVLRNSRTMT